MNTRFSAAQIWHYYTDYSIYLLCEGIKSISSYKAFDSHQIMISKGDNASELGQILNYSHSHRKNSGIYLKSRFRSRGARAEKHCYRFTMVAFHKNCSHLFLV